MKKLVTILFLFSFWANAQMKFQPTESYKFTLDKGLHSIVGGVTSAGFFSFALHKGGNAKDALVASIVIPSLLGLGKEILDNYNGSLADFTYTSGTAIIVGFTMYFVKKRKDKKKAKKIEQKFDIEDNIVYSLDNEIFLNKQHGK